MKNHRSFTAAMAIGLAVALLAQTLGPLPWACADEFVLPRPGQRIFLSPAYNPPTLKGIKVHSEDPLRFDFILDTGNSRLGYGELKAESARLIKYFLAGITIPEKDLWVNLSPFEKDRIIPRSFGLTEMGRDLLAEDYMLKQITASLIYPQDAMGKKFWNRVYEEAAKRFGTTNIPVNTFNKVWIVPEKAVVYENAKAATAYVVESKLKVMLEQDYRSLQKHVGIQFNRAGRDAINGVSTNQLGSQIVREIVIPQLNREVNENKSFAPLRQVYSSLIMANWYKRALKNSILSQVYGDKNKTAGISIADPAEKQKIYERYLQAFKKGVYNYIHEDVDPVTREVFPRKYFSGGTNLAMASVLKVSGDPSQIARSIPVNGLHVEAQIQASGRAPAVQPANGQTSKMDLIRLKDYFLKLTGKSTVNIKTFTLERRDVDRLRKGLTIKENWKSGWRELPDDFIGWLKEGDIVRFDLKAIAEVYGYNEQTIRDPDRYLAIMIVMNMLVYEIEKKAEELGIAAVPFRELFKNALVHGNGWNTNQPIYAFINWGEGGRIHKLHVIDMGLRNKDLSYSFEDANNDIYTGLTGQGVGLSDIKSKYTYDRDYILPQGNGRHGLNPQDAVVDFDGQAPLEKGGIDLSAGKMPLVIRNSGQAFGFHLDPVMFAQLKEAPGFVPVIISIQPLADIRAFLGLKNV